MQITTAEAFGQGLIANGYVHQDLFAPSERRDNVIHSARCHAFDVSHDVMNTLGFWSNIYMGILGEAHQELAAIYAFTHTMSANERPI